MNAALLYILNKEKSKADLVNKINILLEASSRNSSDAGGTYNQDLDGYRAAIEDLMIFLGLDKDYEIIDTGNLDCFSAYKIVLKENNNG